jgi:hypothetical protein
VPIPLHRVPPAVRKTLQSVKVKRRRLKSAGGEVHEVEEVEYKAADRLAAIEKLGKQLGLWKDLAPIDQLLAALPPRFADRVRAELARELEAGSGDGHAPGPEVGPEGEPTRSMWPPRAKPGR